MIYDVLLSLRGWGVEEFRLATRETAELARFALYAEKLSPALSGLEQVIDMPLPDDTAARVKAARSKIEAQRELPRIRAALGLDDGG